MDRYAILLDAGYFFAAGGTALSPGNVKVKRADVALKNHTGLLGEFQSLIASLCNSSSLLRMYWYDAPPRGLYPSGEQESIGRLPGVKLRLGNLNNQGEQKGVDSLIITDLIDLARNAAVADVVLVSGDEDLRVGVSVAQSYGVRVHLLGIGDAANNTSPRLLMESDGQIVADRTWLSNVLEIRSTATPAPAGMGATPPAATPGITPPPPPSPGLMAIADKAIDELFQGRTPEEVATLKGLLGTPKSSIPPEYDRKMLARIGGELGQSLQSHEKSMIRKLFRTKAASLA